VHGLVLRPDGYHFDTVAARFVAERLLPRVLTPVFSAVSTNANPSPAPK
jgi:hypothetical protein